MEQETRQKIKGVLLDVENNEAKVVEFEPTLENYYSMLHCNMIEYASRHIGPKRGCREFDIVCDEEGTFKDEPKISAIDNIGNPMLVGSIMIVGSPDAEGNETSLSDDDCKFIIGRIVTLSTTKDPLGYKMLTQCEY